MSRFGDEWRAYDSVFLRVARRFNIDIADPSPEDSQLFRQRYSASTAMILPIASRLNLSLEAPREPVAGYEA
jgi:hypothetical protein